MPSELTSTSVLSPTPGQSDIRRLCDLAAHGLRPMFSPDEGLFCRRFVREGGSSGRMVQDGLSYRYTIMSFLGLLEYERSGGISPIPLKSAIERLIEQKNTPDNIGDLGLLLWLCAKSMPEKTSEVFRMHQADTALERYAGARERNTMELSWFLTGLAYAGISDLALKTYEALRTNQGAHGFFGHSTSTGSVTGRFRGSVGSFADQVYPIYAFSTFFIAFSNEEAMNSANQCAKAICDVQGSLGQWWWHYDAKSGRVVQQYPVYSVHQHAMGPMALLKAMQAGKLDFTESILKGLAWIYGANELETPTLDESLSVVWRSILPQSRIQMRADQAMAYLRLPKELEKNRRLRMLYECWPYELGWLLYAFSNTSF
jgi:hypothetical protein